MSRHSARDSEQKTIHYRRPAQAVAPPDLHVPVPGFPMDRQPERPRFRWGIILLSVLILALLLAGSAGAAAYLYQRDRILPRVHTLGVTLGGLREEEAAAALERNWNARQITIEAGAGVVRHVSPATLGIYLDAEATAHNAFRQGRDILELDRTIRRVISETGFEPTWRFDPAAARSALEEISRQVSVNPVDAGIRFAGGRVEATPAQAGSTLDVDASVSWLQENAGLVVLSGRLPVTVRVLEPAIKDSSEVAAQLNQELAREVRLLAYDPIKNEQVDVIVPPETWTQWLILKVDQALPGNSNWEIDRDRLQAYLGTQDTALGPDRYLNQEEATEGLTRVIQGEQEVARVRVYHREATHVVQAGETFSSIAYDYGIPYPWIQQANASNGDGLRPGQTITIPSPDVLLPLAPVEGKRIVVSISQQRMWVYEGGDVRWEWPVSTGIDSSPTAPGIFQIQSHEANAYAANWDLWMPNFMGIYRPVPTSDFMNGFHGFPTRNGANLLWTNSLGQRVTYGCILISNENAPLLYEWAEEGVIVEVQR